MSISSVYGYGVMPAALLRVVLHDLPEFYEATGTVDLPLVSLYNKGQNMLKDFSREKYMYAHEDETLSELTVSAHDVFTA